MWSIAAVAQTEVKKEYYPSGKIKLEYTLVNGKKEGIEKQYDEEDGLIFESNYKNGLMHGKHIQWSDYSNGIKYNESDYIAGKLHGIEKIYNNDGSLLRERNYVNGVIEGL